jgi:serine/threonine-protein kinase
MTSPGHGTIIAGRYRLTEQLGQGGMGSVWRAEHMTLNSAIAVKLIDPEIAGKPEMLERFQREAQAAAALRSPHVVQIIDYGVDASVPYIAMELLDGETLAERLRKAGRLSNLETVRVVTHVARALSKAHDAGVVHRDLKPDNVFLVPNDDHEIAKVLDFGVAKHSKLGSGKGPTRTGLILGTPGYMSPEQAQGTKTVDARTDLWALGVIAYECVVGKVPFESEALGDLLIKICVHPIPVPSENGPVPPGFDAWFARACCRDPEQRFQTAKELSDALRAVLAPDLERSTSLLGIDDPSSSGRGALASGAVWPPSNPPGVQAGPTVLAGRIQVQAPQAGTVPGMSVALQTTPHRSAAPLVAAVVVIMMALGAAGGWFLFGRRQKPLPEAASALAPPVPAQPADAQTAKVTAEPPGPAAGNAAPLPSVVPSVTADVPAAPNAKAPDAARGASPGAAKSTPKTAGQPAPIPPAVGPKDAPHPAPHEPPAPHPAGDQRLGF